MAKHKLSDLIGDPRVPNLQSPALPEHQITQESDLQSSVLPEKQTAKESESDTTKEPDLQSLEQDEGIPLYQQLYRKECRLTESQIDRLNTLARRLNRSKRDKGSPRITENTLIRVAVAYLLERGEGLKGSTEEELLQSLEDTDLQS